MGYPVPWDWISDNIKRGQDYLLQNTTLGIPALVQTEGTDMIIALDQEALRLIATRLTWILDRQCYDLQFSYWLWKLVESRGKWPRATKSYKVQNLKGHIIAGPEDGRSHRP